MANLLFAVRACDDFNRLSTQANKLGDQLTLTRFIVRITSWMRQHRHAACAVYPVQCLFNARPFVRDKPRFALNQVILKHVAHTFDFFIRHHHPRKMRACEQIHASACFRQCPLKRVFNPNFFECLRHHHGAFGASTRVGR